MIRVCGKEELPVLSNATETLYYKQTLVEKNTLQIKVCNKDICTKISGSPIAEFSRTKDSEKNCLSNELTETTTKNVLKTSSCSAEQEKDHHKSNEVGIQKKSDQNMAAKTFPVSENLLKRMNNIYSTFAKMKNNIADPNLSNIVKHPPISIPMKQTSDGTKIYYICDLPKNVIKG